MQPTKRNSLKSNRKSYKFSHLIKIFFKTVRQLKFLQLQRKNQHKLKKNNKSLLLPKKALIQQDNNISPFLNRQLAYSSLFLIWETSILCINIHSLITLIFSHNLYWRVTNHPICQSDWKISKHTSCIRCIQIFVDHCLKRINFYFLSF